MNQSAVKSDKREKNPHSNFMILPQNVFFNVLEAKLLQPSLVSHLSLIPVDNNIVLHCKL